MSKKILTKEELSTRIYEYYLKNYGERDTDIWYEQPAVNVMTFGRDGEYISLKAHILTGEIEVFVERVKA